MLFFKFWFTQLLLLLSTVLIGELHTFWERSPIVYHGVLCYKFDWPCSIQWYIKDNGEMLNWVIVSWVVVRFAKKLRQVVIDLNRADLKVSSKIFLHVSKIYLAWRLFDIIMYWYNYKTYGYGFVYLAAVIVGVITYHIKWKRKRLNPS